MAYSKRTPPMNLLRLIVTDVLVFGISLLSFAYFHHVRPQQGGTGTVIHSGDPSDVPREEIPDDADYTWSLDVNVVSPVRLFLTDENKVVKADPADELLKGLSASDAVCELIDRAVSVGRINDQSVLSLTLAQVTDESAGVASLDAVRHDAEQCLAAARCNATVEASVPFLGLGAKFYDKFNLDGDVQITETSYVSDKVAVFLSETEYEGAVCHIADVYLRDVHDYRTVLAKDTFGKHFSESVESMSAPSDKYPDRALAILAVNGDYYGTHSNSFIVRNGILYDGSRADDDICVLYSDGTMVSYYEDSFDEKDAAAKGAWQAWSFGPKLLDNGQIPTKFNTSVNPANPRTALGYYEPGHYCIVAVDGRSDESRGLKIKQLAAFFADLGCVDAYNLDGGNTSVMYFNGSLTNVRSGDGKRPCSDAIIIADLP